MPTAIKLNIVRPCNQDWEQMTSSAEGHYCQSCQKTIVDFSVMSDKEILQYMEQAMHTVCGRFTNDQLQRVYKSEATGARLPLRKNFWQMLIAGTLTAQQLNSQVTAAPCSPNIHEMPVRDTALPDDNVYEIIDGFSKQPLNGATIIGGDMQAISDEQGKFKFNMLRDKITISHVGYETREFLLSDALMPKRIELAPKSDVLPEVSIMASGHTQCTRRLGAVSIVRVITPFQNFVRKMEQWIPDSAVKVFPNPINKGQMLNVQFSLPAPGKYALSIFAVDGRLLHVQPILITDAKQMFRLPTSWAYAAGIYWLHIRNTLGKEKVYEIKLVLK